MSHKHRFIFSSRFALLRNAVLVVPLLLAACHTAPPRQPDDLCAIFHDNRSWQRYGQAAQDKYGIPLQILFAIIYQESGYRHNALPPKKYFLGFIPTGRASSAQGYAQAKNEVWSEYQQAVGHSASRSSMKDSLDFVGWYSSKSNILNGTSKWDAYNLYLNYHEGWGGFSRKTHLQKDWLLKVARKVEQRASDYGAQYRNCSP